MTYETLEQFQALIPDEQSARKYLSSLRWGQYAACPYCNNKKCYFIENNKRFKCASHDCKKKFSVTTKTIMEGTKIELNKWAYAMFLYCKSRGRVGFEVFQETLSVNFNSISDIHQKIDFAWQKVEREVGDSVEHLMQKLVKSMSFCYDIYDPVIKKNSFHIGEFELNNISEPKQYFRLLMYTKWYIKYYATWVFEDFTTAQDVISEAILKMNEDGIKEYNTSVILKYVRNSYDSMWKSYINNSKKIHVYMHQKNKQYQRAKSEKLTDGYVVNELRKSLKTSAKEVRKMLIENPGMVERKRKEILAVRSTNYIIKNSGVNELSKFIDLINEFKSKIGLE